MPATLNFSSVGAIGTGWNTLPLGCGGLVTGIHIASDNKMVCRTDVGNIYAWSGTTADYADPLQKWLPLLNNSSLDAMAGAPANPGSDLGGWELVQAPGNSNILVSIFSDMNGAYKSWIYYSTNRGATWIKTNIQFATASAASNGPPGGDTRNCSYKIAVDPANPNVAYCGMPSGSGNAAGVYTTLNQAGGSTLATWASVKSSGSTAIPAAEYGISCGLVIDPSMGTTTVGGQTVTKHIILPAGDKGIWESVNGGVSFTEIALTAFGTGFFFTTTGKCNFDGVYYCIVVQMPHVRVWNAADWTTASTTITLPANPGVKPGMSVVDAQTTNIIGTVLTYVGTTLTLTAPAAYASVGGGNPLDFKVPAAAPVIGGVWRYVPGVTAGGGTWTYITSGGATYPPATYTPNTFLIVDPRNTVDAKKYLSVFGPNGINAGYTSINANTGTPVVWDGYTGGQDGHLCAASYDMGWINDIFGQGPAFTYGVAAAIDTAGRCWWSGNQSFFYFGSSSSDPAPTTTGGPVYHYPPGSLYSWSMGRGQEMTVAVDVFCPPGGTYPILGLHDVGSPMRGTFTTYPQTMAHKGLQYACTNLEYAADDTSFVVARVTTQSGYVDASCYSASSGADDTWVVPAQNPSAMYEADGCLIYGGITVAADRDHWVTLPNGLGGPIKPSYTTNARGAATWAFCGGLPKADWWSEPWFYGTYTPKPLAVGYGSDLGTVWACLKTVGDLNWTLYRSTDYGANFTSVLTWSSGTGGFSSFCLSVPGFPNELWITSRYASGVAGLWHITNARTGTITRTEVNLPPLLSGGGPQAFTLGAPATPGGYPTLYMHGNTAGFASQEYLYEGQYPGTGAVVTWSLFGATGTRVDLPASCQLSGIQSLRADWNVYRRLYVSSRGSGFAYYNP